LHTPILRDTAVASSFIGFMNYLAALAGGVLLVSSGTAQAQMGIGTPGPNAKAGPDLQSSSGNKARLPCRPHARV
jgi:hypothetical protein